MSDTQKEPVDVRDETNAWIWNDTRISNEASEATDELDGSVYVRHVISQSLVKMRNEYETALANQYQRINRFVELIDELEAQIAYEQKVYLRQHDYIRQLEDARIVPPEVMDTIRRSLVSSESINGTDAWYKRMTTALKWLDTQAKAQP